VRVTLLTMIGILPLMGGVFIAAWQAEELKGGTRRHLFALGLTPAELLLGKLVAAVVGLIASDGAVLVAVTVEKELGLSNDLRLAAMFAGANLCSLVLWAAVLLSRSWPKVGTVLVIVGISGYFTVLGAVPWLHGHANLFNLLIFWMPGATQVTGPLHVPGAAVTAVLFIGAGMALTWLGQRIRVVA
jgi:hypothetical protein